MHSSARGDLESRKAVGLFGDRTARTFAGKRGGKIRIGPTRRLDHPLPGTGPEGPDLRIGAGAARSGQAQAKGLRLRCVAAQGQRGQRQIRVFAQLGVRSATQTRSFRINKLGRDNPQGNLLALQRIGGDDHLAQTLSATAQEAKTDAGAKMR
jgi:hypothetical protein